MSLANVEIVRRVYESAGRRDSAAVLALYDPHVELDNTRLGIVGGAGGVYRGHEGMRRFFREWHEALEVEYDYDELIDAGDDSVVSVVTRRGRGRISGAGVELRAALVWTIHEGKVARVVWFQTRAEALDAARAAGVPENGAEELARAVLDAWTKADREGFLALMHPDVEMYLPRAALEEKVYRGVDGAAQAWADGFDIWERFELELRAVRAVGDVVIGEYHGRQHPRGEGPPVQYSAYPVFQVRDGRIAYWRAYLDRDEALGAARARFAG